MVSAVDSFVSRATWYILPTEHVGYCFVLRLSLAAFPALRSSSRAPALDQLLAFCHPHPDPGPSSLA